MFRGRYARLAILGAAGLAACGGNDVVLPNDRLAAKIVAVHGDNQSGTVGGALADSAVVRVTDAKDQPVSGQTVTFSIVSGRGSVSPGTTTTDANGLAGTRWTLGGVAGAQQVKAQATGNGAPANVSVVVNASAGASAASEITLVGGDNQSGTAGSPLADSLVVKATDADGNPVAGAAVQWTVSGGGTVSAATTPTGADGHAAVKRTLGPSAGAQTAVATATGLTGSPITFHSSATVGSAGQLSITRQPPAAAASGVAFATQPQVQLRDANGNPVSQGGVAVQVQLASGPPSGGLIGSTTAATNGGGLATFSGLGISGPAGDYFLSFFGSGLSGVTSAQITIAAGSATKLVLQTQPSSSAANGVAFATQPAVQLADASGNPVLQSGVSVSVVLGSGSGSLGGTTTATTDGGGLAAFTDLVITGNAGARTLLFAAACCSTVTSSAINVGAGSPDGAKSSFDVSGGPITASTGSSTATVSVTARDASGNPVAGAAPGVDITSCGSASAPLTDATGSSSVAVSCTTGGTKTVSVAINGTPVSNPAGTHTLTVNPASSATTLSASPAGGSTFGQQVTFTATVTGGVNTPTGTVTFKNGGTTMGSSPLVSGVATFSTATLVAGTNSVTAVYGSDPTYSGSTSSATDYNVSVLGTTTTVTSSDQNSVFGEGVSFTATVAGLLPTGTVQFSINGSAFGGPVTLSGGSATSAVTSSLPAASYSVTATYSGGSGNGGSSGTLSQSVAKASTNTSVTSDANPADFGQPVTFTATVTPIAPGAGTPDGSVQFVDGGTNIGAPQILSGGAAGFTTSALSTGSDQITALFQGSANFAGGTSAALAQTVVAATSTTITNSAALATPSNAGDPVTVQFSVSAAPGAGTPTGTVTVTFDSGGSCTAGVAAGQCNATPVGAATTVHVSATYTPDTGNFAGSTSSAVDHPIN